MGIFCCINLQKCCHHFLQNSQRMLLYLPQITLEHIVLCSFMTLCILCHQYSIGVEYCMDGKIHKHYTKECVKYDFDAFFSWKMEKDIEFNLKSIFNTLDIVELFYHHEQYIYIYLLGVNHSLKTWLNRQMLASGPMINSNS